MSRLPDIVEDQRSRTHANGSKEEDEEESKAYGEEEDDEAPEEEGLTTHRTRPALCGRRCSRLLRPRATGVPDGEGKGRGARALKSAARGPARQRTSRMKRSARESGLFLWVYALHTGCDFLGIPLPNKTLLSSFALLTAS